MKTDKELIEEYLAAGGKITRLPTTRVNRDDLIPKATKDQQILDDLLRRAGVEDALGG